MLYYVIIGVIIFMVLTGIVLKCFNFYHKRYRGFENAETRIEREKFDLKRKSEEAMFAMLRESVRRHSGKDDI